MLDTWLWTYSDSAGRDFEVLPTGSREAFRGWLLDRFDLLGRYGYPARIATEDADGLDGLGALLRRRSSSRHGRPDHRRR